jgi:hypothetical protein
MRVYTFTVEEGTAQENYFEFYDKRYARKEAIKQAVLINKPVYVICMHKPSYRQDWYTAMPDGRWWEDGKSIRFDN